MAAPCPSLSDLASAMTTIRDNTAKVAALTVGASSDASHAPVPRVIIAGPVRVEVEDMCGESGPSLLALSIREGAVSMRAILTPEQAKFLFARADHKEAA